LNLPSLKMEVLAAQLDMLENVKPILFLTWACRSSMSYLHHEADSVV
jgi:hemolysin-activating ACP:hemolysin acyltransferase